MGRVPASEVLLTTRCRLRQPNEADIAHVWTATRVAGFNEGMRWEAPDEIDALRAPLRHNREDWDRGTQYSFTVESRDAKDFIGRVQLRCEPGPHRWTLGFWTHPEAQGRGYAAEAAAALLDFGFDRLGAVVIGAAHATWNEASRKVLLRIGMRYVRTNPRGFRKHGVWVEEYEYELQAREGG